MTKKYSVELTEQQLQVISTACELLSRIQGGQVREVFDHLPLKEDMNWEAYHEIQDELTKRMPEILKDGIDGWSSSFGVGNPKLPPSHDIAWDLHTTIRHQLSWESAIEKGWVKDFNSSRDWSKMIGVYYDKPFGWGAEPLPVIKQIEE